MAYAWPECAAYGAGDEEVTMPPSTYYAVLLALVIGVGCGEKGKEKTTPKAQAKFRAEHNRFNHIIQQAADLYQFPPAIIKAVIWRESRFNPDARGTSWEYGLMQIREAAAHEWALAAGVTGFRTEHLLNPKTNIRAGTWYLKKWSDRAPHADNPLPFALATYNAGPTKAREWAKDTNSSAELFIEQINYPATRGYVQDILKKQVEFRKMFEK